MKNNRSLSYQYSERHGHSLWTKPGFLPSPRTLTMETGTCRFPKWLSVASKCMYPIPLPLQVGE